MESIRVFHLAVRARAEFWGKDEQKYKERKTNYPASIVPNAQNSKTKNFPTLF